MSALSQHLPVMVDEVISYLDPKKKNTYFDGTFGQGGYSEEILKYGCKVVATDKDTQSENFAKIIKQKYPGNFYFRIENFKNIEEILKFFKISKINGITLDLGLSNTQLDSPSRGFSFKSNGPLDMRMNNKKGEITAEIVVNKFSEKNLSDIFYYYGDEKNSRKIAKSIVIERKKKIIKTTTELAGIVKRINSYNHKNPSTRVFQALRIFVNDELNVLESFLGDCLKFLNKKSRIIIVAFHSLEDRIVKNFFKENSSKLKIITKKPVTPTKSEIENNPRSRSAKLRVAEVL